MKNRRSGWSSLVGELARPVWRVTPSNGVARGTDVDASPAPGPVAGGWGAPAPAALAAKGAAGAEGVEVAEVIEGEGIAAGAAAGTGTSSGGNTSGPASSSPEVWAHTAA